MKNNISRFFREISWQNLLHTEHATAMPIVVALFDSKQKLEITEIIRLIPGKRLVAFANWGDKQVVAKVFYELHKAKTHFEREVTGSNALQTSGIPTPKMYYQGTDTAKQIYIILFERILEAESLEAIWQNRHHDEKFNSLMHAITIELATQHVLGILQEDLHFDNFLISKNNIYTLDSGSIKSFNMPLDKKLSLNNLAMFFSQMGLGVEKLQQELYLLYFQSRGWPLKDADTQFLKSAMAKITQQRWKNFEEKIFRNSTAFASQNTPATVIMYDREYYSERFLSFLQDPEALFSHPAAKVLKAGRSSTVIKIAVDGQIFVIKRYNLKDLWHRMRRLFRPSRAANSWRLAHCLRLLGIPTAKPIAFIENRFLGLRGKSYLIMEFVSGVHAGEYFSAYQADNENFKLVGERILKVFESLSHLLLTHGDLKMTNIIIQNHFPVLLDLDGMKQHYSQQSFQRAYMGEIERFLLNWNNKPVVRKFFDDLITESIKADALPS